MGSRHGGVGLPLFGAPSVGTSTGYGWFGGPGSWTMTLNPDPEPVHYPARISAATPVPAPLPLLGVGAVFGYSRKLRSVDDGVSALRRLKKSIPAAAPFSQAWCCPVKMRPFQAIRGQPIVVFGLDAVGRRPQVVECQIGSSGLRSTNQRNGSCRGATPAAGAQQGFHRCLQHGVRQRLLRPLHLSTP